MPAGRLECAAGRPAGLALIAIILTLAPSGCGGAHRATATSATASTGRATMPAASPAARTTGYSKRDGDSDSDDEHPPLHFGNDDGPLFASYGGRAGPADTRAITALVKRYYAASAGGDGARACSLLSSSLAAGVASEYGHSAHEGCAASVSALLAEQRRRFIAEDIPTMLITAVHVKGNLGLAVLSFKTTPESQIVLAREGRVWKIDALFDTYMP
jgi:hypothetical protein